MKLYCLLVILTLFYLNANCNIVDIIGSIADSTTQQSLPFGNIVIKNSNDSIIQGTLTNEKGEFKLKSIDLQKGDYLLIKYLGYIDKRLELNYTTSSKIKFDKILLKPDINNIQEANVVGKTKYMEQRFDRKVFNISTAKTTSAKNIFDLLRTLPGVTVDQSENVKFKGLPATIYVDDQPAEYIYPKTNMIPVASVLKIELIDASLRSGAGKGGIINIKMRDLTTDGLSGVVQADNRTIDFNELNNSDDFLNLNYKVKKVIFFNNSSYEYNITNSSITNNGTINYNSNNYTSTNTATRFNNVNSFSDYGGVSFSPNSNTKIRLSGGYYKNRGELFYKYYSQLNENISNSVIDKYNVSAEKDYKNLIKWLNTSFYHSFDTLGKELSIWAGLQDQSHGYYNSSNNIYNYQIIANLPSDSTYSFNNIYDWGLNAVYGGIYYNHPINVKTRWNCGWNGWIAFKGHENHINSQNDVIIYPTTQYDKFNDQDQSVYWRIGTTIKKWKFDAGISSQYNKNVAEFIRYNIDSKDTLIKINKDFLNFLPSATIIYSPDSTQEIKLTYSKSINSLWYDQLNDFVNKENFRNWTAGNSKLKQTIYNNFYLGYLYNKDKWNINTDIFYSITNNDISNITIPVNEVISITIPENIAHNRNVGIELSSWVSLKEKYDFNFSSSINHTNISSSDLDDTKLKKKDFGFNIKFSSDIIFNNKTSATFYANYFSREITFEGYKFDYINSSISLTQKFFDSKLLLTIGVNNLFDNLVKHGSYYNFSGIIQTTSESSSSYQPTYFLTLQYKFRQGDRGTKDSGSGMSKGK